MKRILLACAAVCTVALTISLCLLLHAATQEIKGLRSAAVEQIETTRRETLLLLNARVKDAQTQVLGEVDRQATGLQTQLGETRRQLFERVDDIHGTVIAASAEGVAQINQARRDATDQIAQINATLASVTSHANGLMDTYAALPERVGAQLQPSWLAIQPEITCRQLDGSGYGGCWHGRVTALMGEAARVGGVFTQRFPEFSQSITGIAGDVHTFTSRAVAPRGFWGTVKDIAVTGSGVARAAGAAGVF